MKMYAILSLFVLLASQGPIQAAPKQSSLPAERPPQAASMSYEQACNAALRLNKTLVVFVGCDGGDCTTLNDCVTCTVKDLKGYTSGVAVIAKPDSGRLWHYTTTQPSVTACRSALTTTPSTSQGAIQGGCANGSCGAPTSSYRGYGLFRR